MQNPEVSSFVNQGKHYIKHHMPYGSETVSKHEQISDISGFGRSKLPIVLGASVIVGVALAAMFYI